MYSGSGSGQPSGGQEPPEDRILRFGKHEGERIGDVSSSYLRWLLGNVRLHEEDEQAIEEVLIERGDG